MGSLALLALDDNGWGDELLVGSRVTASLALATLPIGLALGLAVASSSLSDRRTSPAASASTRRSHETSFAREVSNRTVFLHRGRIAEEGASSELFAAPRSEALRRFLASVRR